MNIEANLVSVDGLTSTANKDDLDTMNLMQLSNVQIRQ